MPICQRERRTVLTLLERRILRELQERFPVVSHPYSVIARRLGLSEKELIVRVRDLKRKGFIRYVGIVFSLNQIGFRSTLIAMRIPKSRIRKVTRIINASPHVTHNYLREGPFNIWFTVSAPSRAGLSREIRKIAERSGVKEMLDLPAEKTFKIGAVFKI